MGRLPIFNLALSLAHAPRRCGADPIGARASERAGLKTNPSDSPANRVFQQSPNGKSQVPGSLACEEIPKPRLQIPNKFQRTKTKKEIPNSGAPFWILEIEDYLEPGIWVLAFPARALSGRLVDIIVQFGVLQAHLGSAGFQPAARGQGLRAQPTGSRRYSRLETCATIHRCLRVSS